MKISKKVIGILTALCLCLGSAGNALAAEKGSCSPVRGSFARLGACVGRFMDADGDGVCDNRIKNFIDADGDGVCDNCGNHFTDTNGDGICDNNGQGGRGKHHGRR